MYFCFSVTKIIDLLPVLIGFIVAKVFLVIILLLFYLLRKYVERQSEYYSCKTFI